MYLINVILLVLLLVSIEAITVSPLCPTNKIAPRRKSVRRYRSESRTFGAFYDLLTPGSPQSNSQLNDLQEKPQEDDPDDDCGDIEDYDENDLSSITTQSQRRQGLDSKRGFIDGIFQRPPYYNPVNRPPSSFLPQRPSYPLSRPPFWSGGTFGNNNYRPPMAQYPSDYVKPVHENSQQEPPAYRPDVVGGVLGHVVGATPIRPTERPDNGNLRRRPKHYPSYTTFSPIINSNEPANRERLRTNNMNPNSIFGSFIDLLFK